MSEEIPYATDPYHEGMMAYYNGSENPWPAGSKNNERFSDGWLAAQEGEERRRAGI